MECFYYLKDPISFVKKVHDDWMNTGGWIVMGVDHYEEIRIHYLGLSTLGCI